MEREAGFRARLRDVILKTIKKARFHGLEFKNIEPGFKVGSRHEADLALLTPTQPFLFIETKRKGARESELFDPTSALVLGQVMVYAAIWKRQNKQDVPFVATANPGLIAVFRVPKDIDKKIDWNAVLKRDYAGAIKRVYRNLLEECLVDKVYRLQLTSEFIGQILDQLAAEYTQARFYRAEPTRVLVGRFRGFVNTVAECCAPLLERMLREDSMFREQVGKLGYATEEEQLGRTARLLARMMAYVLMNKLIFRKILEKTYAGIPPLVGLDTSSSSRFREDLRRHFEIAVSKTQDFEPIFYTGVYDRLPIPDDPELMEYINEFIYDLEQIELLKIADQIGYMYEVLIPPEERHQFGQFYTPPWVCELITRWCIRDQEDKVFDPGVGSGGFILQAYRRLAEFRGRSPDSMMPREIHERILEQLYALDINPFPAHLTAMGLSMRALRSPSTKLKVLVADFFLVQPKQKVLSPYTVKTIVGEEHIPVVFGDFDAVIGNPPYTRWTEIPDETQKLIKKHLGELMKRYKLTPQVSRGVEPGIYTYWILHAHEFLKEGGRLGMIISNTWLQTDYGIGFGNFLLDHFRIKAVIDFAAKLFKDALITTCIVLAERESEEAKRLENEVVFIHIPGEVESVDVGSLLEAVRTGESQEFTVVRVKQKDIPRDRKWIDLFFRAVDLSKHPLIVKLGELFEPLRGNTEWARWALAHGRRPDLGMAEFHYLSPSKLEEFNLSHLAYPNMNLNECFLYPAITRAKQSLFFTFNQKDWKRLLQNNDRCYILIAHKPRNQLPAEIKRYIDWGETRCIGKVKARQIGARGKTADKTEAAKVRATQRRFFYGWYDVGGVLPCQIFAIREARYKTRFALCKFPVATFDRIITFIPKKKPLAETELKALLAFLNSSFMQFQVELQGRYVAAGPIGFDVKVAREMPVLDVRKLDEKQLKRLAKLFDELEREARRIGGASTREQLEQLKPKIYEIDYAIGEILGLTKEEVEDIQRKVELMVERRVGVAKKTGE